MKERTLRVAADLARAFPNSAEALAVQAIALNRFGRSDEALRCWQTCLELDSNFADAYHGMATILAKKGDYRQTADLARKALNISPSMPGVHALLAESLMGSAEIEEAILVLNQGANVFPESGEIAFWLGQANLQLKRYEQAKECHQHAIQLDPASTYAYYGLATACARLGQTEEFRQHMERFKQRKADDQAAERERLKAYDDQEALRRGAAFIYLAIGEIYLRQNELSQSEKALRESARLDPLDAMCRVKLVSLYHQTGQWQPALSTLQQLCEIEPNNPGYLVQLGLLFANMGQFDQAESTLRRAIQVGPQWAGGYVALAQLYLQAGIQTADIRNLARRAVDLEPTAPHFYLLSAVCHQNGDATGALNAITKALERDPQNAEYQRIWASLQEH